MNVDENSELRDGDEGFAVCYNTKKGNFFPYADWSNYPTVSKPLNTGEPEFLFMGTVKATNKGTAVKATKKNRWLSSFHRNKLSLTGGVDTFCNTGGSYYTEDFHYMFAYHDSMWDGNTDYIGIVSEDGFKNTGLKNGDNHLKCWFRASDNWANFY